MSNPYSVVLDSNVLAKALHRNILANLAAAECFRPIWSDTILQEMVFAIDKNSGNGALRRMQLEQAFPGAMADSAYIHLVGKFQLADENDRHVVAVAMQEGADAICTDNQADFTLSTVDVLTSDEFIVNTIDLAPVLAISALRDMREMMTSILNGRNFCELMQAKGLHQTADYLLRYRDRL